MRVDVIYSRDDGGWYAEVVDRATGRTLHTTGTCKAASSARLAAEAWCAAQGPRVLSL